MKNLLNPGKKVFVHGSIKTSAEAIRVDFKGGNEDTAYYTDDLDDAVGTGKLMAKEKKESAKAENKNIIELPEEVSIELEDRTVVLEKGERVEIIGKVEERQNEDLTMMILDYIDAPYTSVNKIQRVGMFLRDALSMSFNDADYNDAIDLIFSIARKRNSSISTSYAGTKIN